MQQGRSRAALALASLLALAGCGADDGRQDGSAPSASGTPSTGGPPPVQDLARSLQPTVEAVRGLRFKEDARVTLLDDAAFRQRLREQSAAGRDLDELRRAEHVLGALRLIPADLHLEKAVDTLLGAGVTGFYDETTQELVVRGTSPSSPAVRATLVHELTHALQDQHFDLDTGRYDDAEDESALGYSAVVEGDASRVEQAYLSTLSQDEQSQAAQEQLAQVEGLEELPPALLQAAALPYLEGPALVRALLEAGGQARLDAAFASPPATSEQVLHPERFLAGEGAKPVPAPQPEGEVVDSGVLGESTLGQLLADADDPLSGEGEQAAEGWGGDRYVAYRKGSRRCVRVNLVMDGAAEAAEVRSRLREWAAGPGDSSVRGRDPITLTSCG